MSQRYLVVRDHSIENFQDQIDHLIGRGYSLVGGVCAYQAKPTYSAEGEPTDVEVPHFAQALLRTAEESVVSQIVEADEWDDIGDVGVVIDR